MAHSRIDGVRNYRPGKVAGVADVPLHGVFLLRQVRLATILTQMQTDAEYIYLTLQHKIKLNVVHGDYGTCELHSWQCQSPCP